MRRNTVRRGNRLLAGTVPRKHPGTNSLTVNEEGVLTYSCALTTGGTPDMTYDNDNVCITSAGDFSGHMPKQLTITTLTVRAKNLTKTRRTSFF